MDINIPNLDIAKYQAEFAHLQQQMVDKASSNDYELLGELNSKSKAVGQIIQLWQDLHKKQASYTSNLELIEDPEFGPIAQEENLELEKEITDLAKKLEVAVLPALSHDQSNAIFEVRAGTGGTEASLFASEIFRMYVRYATNQGFEIEQLSTSYHDEGGIKEAVFMVKGPSAFGKFRFESGVHRVQRVPATEASGRIHTSAISVVVMPEIKTSDVKINESDLKIEIFRSSGPGGQSVNTTDSAVRLTHIPTGISVSCQDGKSQHKNKEKAMSILAAKLFALQQAEQLEFVNDLRSEAIQSGDRSVKIRTYNFPQGRVSDHRIKETWYNLPQVMEGELDQVITTVNSELRKQQNAA